MLAPCPDVSIVCPCQNEEANVGPLVERIRGALAGTGTTFEIIIVDDGSADGTWQAIKSLVDKHQFVDGLKLSRNFGHQSALLAGLSRARGAAVISMDSDLQHPPEVIPKLLEAWRQGAQIVSTRRLDHARNRTIRVVTSIAKRIAGSQQLC